MDFGDRIRTIIKVNNLTTSAFADRIGVQRSGVSHILNGRNRPSMDFLLKVLEAFPRVDAQWLLTGKSPKESNIAPEVEYGEPDVKEESPKKEVASDGEIEKIVIFFKDGTFEVHKPKTDL